MKNKLLQLFHDMMMNTMTIHNNNNNYNYNTDQDVAATMMTMMMSGRTAVNNTNNNNNMTLASDSFVRRSGFQISSTVIAWVLTALFLVDVVVIVGMLITVWVHLKRSRYHTRLKSYLSRNRSFSFSHMLFVAALTCLPLGLRSIRLLLNVHIKSEKNREPAQNIYCRSTAWVWDLSLAALVFMYIGRCLYMGIRYTDKKIKVDNWNKSLKEKWKRYRLFFRERTHTISTFLTPRTTNEFFRGSSKIVRKLKLRRNSQTSMGAIDYGSSPQSPNPQSLLLIETENHKERHKENPNNNNDKESVVVTNTTVASTTTTTTTNEHNPYQVLTPMTDVFTVTSPNNESALLIDDETYSSTTPATEHQQGMSSYALMNRSSPSRSDIHSRYLEIAGDVPPAQQSFEMQETRQHVVEHSSSMNQSQTQPATLEDNNNKTVTPRTPMIPSLNMRAVAQNDDEEGGDDKKTKFVLKQFLTSRKAKYEADELPDLDNMTARRRVDDVDRLKRRASMDINSEHNDIQSFRGVDVESHYEDYDSDDGTDSDEAQHDIGLNVEQTPNKYSFSLDIKRVSKNAKDEKNAMSSARALFTEEELGDEGMNDDLMFQELDEEVGSATSLAIGLQNTMTELLTMPATPKHDKDHSLVRRMSLGSVRRNNEMIALQSSIISGNVIVDPNPSKQRSLSEIMHDRRSASCCKMPKLQLGTKIGLISFSFSVCVFIVLAVLTGAIPWVYPGYAECSKDIFRAVYTYTDPIFYVHLVGAIICVGIYITLSIVVSSLKVYDLLVYEMWGITISSLIVPISIALAPVIYGAGVSNAYAPIQHYLLNFLSFFWLIVFQVCGILVPALGLVYSLNARQNGKDIVSAVKRPIAFFDPNTQTQELEALYPFDIVLTDRNLRDAFRKFLVKMLCPENLFFLDEVALYQQVDSPAKRRELGADIIQRFIRSGSLYELNVSNYEKLSMIEKYQRLNQDCPKNLFKDLESTIRFTLATDCYKKFIASKEMKDVLSSGVSITTASTASKQ